MRDFHSVASALRDIDVVFNAAALKQVPTCEYYPFEAVQTNIGGPENIVRAIRELNLPIETVVGISTDKACKPVNVMGMTKAIQERVFIRANLDCPRTRFMCVRYGNVLASRGSVIPLFHEQIRKGGPVTITTADMTRFLFSLDQAVDTIFAAVRAGSAAKPTSPRALGPHHGPGPGADRGPPDRDQSHRHPARREGPRNPDLGRGELPRGGAGWLLRDPAHPAGTDLRAEEPHPLTEEYSSAGTVMTVEELRALLEARDLLLGTAKSSRPKGAAAMKIMTVLGTRPEIIRLSRVIPKLDALAITCWSIPARTSTPPERIFFSDLGVRQPDHYPRRARQQLRRDRSARS